MTNQCLSIHWSTGWFFVIAAWYISAMLAGSYWYSLQRPHGIPFFANKPYGTDGRSIVAWTFYCFGATSQLGAYGMIVRTAGAGVSRLLLDFYALSWLAISWAALQSPDYRAIWMPLFMWRGWEYIASAFYQRVFGAGFPQRMEPAPENHRMGYRALMIDIINYFALAMMFATMYRATATQFGPVKPDTPANAFYFSIVVMTTLGLGDIAPTTECGRLMVAAEVLFGIFMVAIFVSILIGRRVFYVPRGAANIEQR